MKTLVDECCQTCDGEVYAGGAVISVQEEGGVCGTTVTTECVSYGNNDGNKQCKNIFTFKVLQKQQELKKSIHIHNVAQINMVILNNSIHQKH